jgi:hypothetical protein
MPIQPPLKSLVNQVLAATAILDREIQRLSDLDDGDLSNLSVAVDELTAIAAAHAPLAEQPQTTRREKARKAAKRTKKASDDADAALADLMGPDADPYPDVVEAVGTVAFVIVTVE